jgi:uncharacterized membrane protein
MSTFSTVLLVVLGAVVLLWISYWFNRALYRMLRGSVPKTIDEKNKEKKFIVIGMILDFISGVWK